MNAPKWLQHVFKKLSIEGVNMATQNEKNIQLVRQLLKCIQNPQNIDQYDQFFSDKVTIHAIVSGQEAMGVTAVKKFDVQLPTAFQKRHFEIKDIFAYEDRVVVYWTCELIYVDNEKQTEPKYDQKTISDLSIYRISNGKICEVWEAWDRLGLLEQFGEVHFTPSSLESEAQYRTLQSLELEKYLQNASLLSLRERQCLKCLLEGKTAKETASELNISYRTVESYFENIKDKLNCYSKRELFTTAQILEKHDLL